MKPGGAEHGWKWRGRRARLGKSRIGLVTPGSAWHGAVEWNGTVLLGRLSRSEASSGAAWNRKAEGKALSQLAAGGRFDSETDDPVREGGARCFVPTLGLARRVNVGRQGPVASGSVRQGQARSVRAEGGA